MQQSALLCKVIPNPGEELFCMSILVVQVRDTTLLQCLSKHD